MNSFTDANKIYLNLLRALLSQTVLIGHAGSFFNVTKIIEPPNFPWIQSIAVVGFFWLSGLLISHSTFNKVQNLSHYSFSFFFAERFLRIYLSFIPAFIFVAVIDIFYINYFFDQYQFKETYTLEVGILNFFMLQKMPSPSGSIPLFGSASTWWTLSIEWWLYMLFGWVIVSYKVMWKKTLKLSLKYAAVLLLLSIFPLYNIFYGNNGTGTGLAVIWLLACIIPFVKNKISRHLSHVTLLTLSALFLLLTYFRYKKSMNSYDFIAMLFLGITFLLSISFFQKINTRIDRTYHKITVFFANYSFTLFLTHYTVLLFFVYSGMNGWSGFIFSVILSNLIAIFIALPTEMKHKKLKNHLHQYLNSLATRK